MLSFILYFVFLISYFVLCFLQEINGDTLVALNIVSLCCQWDFFFFLTDTLGWWAFY